MNRDAFRFVAAPTEIAFRSIEMHEIRVKMCSARYRYLNYLHVSVTATRNATDVRTAALLRFRSCQQHKGKASRPFSFSGLSLTGNGWSVG
jgi:hypothetical protein